MKIDRHTRLAQFVAERDRVAAQLALPGNQTGVFGDELRYALKNLNEAIAYHTAQL